MFSRPNIISVNEGLVSFDATQNHIIEFISQGDQVFFNELEIIDNNTNKQVYLQKQETFKFEHNILANSLVNGTEYKARIKVYNISNEVSEWSDYVYFQCLSTPTIDIINFDKTTDNQNLVGNQTFNPKGSYHQTENEPIKSYKYFLYDEHEVLLSQSKEIFNSNLTYEFTNLQNEKHYYIGLKIITQHGIEVSIKRQFLVRYIQPKMANAIKLKNDYQNASIGIRTNVIQVLFKLLQGKISFENGEIINLKNGSIYTNKENGFNLTNNKWTMKLWLKDLEEDKPFLYMYEDKKDENAGKMKLVMYDNKIHLIKEKYGQEYHIYSNDLGIVSVDDTIFIFIQNDVLRMNLKAEKI